MECETVNNIICAKLVPRSRWPPVRKINGPGASGSIMELLITEIFSKADLRWYDLLPANVYILYTVDV